MPASQISERWDWEGSRAIGADLEKARRSHEHGVVERLSRDLAGQAVKRSGVLQLRKGGLWHNTLQLVDFNPSVSYTCCTLRIVDYEPDQRY